MNPISKQFSSIEQVTGQYLKQKNVTSPSKTSDVSFEDVLRQQQQLKFSKHASQRLESRNISLSEEQNARLEDGVEQAHAKGIKDSLVLVDSPEVRNVIYHGTDGEELFGKAAVTDGQVLEIGGWDLKIVER